MQSMYECELLLHIVTSHITRNLRSKRSIGNPIATQTNMSSVWMWSVTSSSSSSNPRCSSVYGCEFLLTMYAATTVQHPRIHIHRLFVLPPTKEMNPFQTNAERTWRTEKPTKRNFLWLWFSTHSSDDLFSFVLRFLRFSQKPVRVCACVRTFVSVCVRRSCLASSHQYTLFCCMCARRSVHRLLYQHPLYYAYHTNTNQSRCSSHPFSKIFLFSMIEFVSVCGVCWGKRTYRFRLFASRRIRFTFFFLLLFTRIDFQFESASHLIRCFNYFPISWPWVTDFDFDVKMFNFDAKCIVLLAFAIGMCKWIEKNNQFFIIHCAPSKPAKPSRV